MFRVVRGEDGSRNGLCPVESYHESPFLAGCAYLNLLTPTAFPFPFRSSGDIVGLSVQRRMNGRPPTGSYFAVSSSLNTYPAFRSSLYNSSDWRTCRSRTWSRQIECNATQIPSVCLFPVLEHYVLRRFLRRRYYWSGLVLASLYLHIIPTNNPQLLAEQVHPGNM